MADRDTDTGQTLLTRSSVLKLPRLYNLIPLYTQVFLAPTGAQNMVMFVCQSGLDLSRALNLHLLNRLQVSQSSVSSHHQVSHQNT